MRGNLMSSRLQFSNWGFGQDLRRNAGMLIVPAAVFLLIAGIGATTSYLGGAHEVTGSSRSGSHGEPLARLKDYTRSIGAEASAPEATASKLLPDVNTMIDRLAARLETTPDDVKGWRTLGWSYFYTGRYQEAANAYAKAVELDPNSKELKFEYEEVKAKASESDSPAVAPPAHAEAAGKIGDGPSAEQVAQFQAMPAHEREAAIRAMVDGLAGRLESSPRDVEGWMRLMRSRVVLGEREVAATAARKALDVFKDDPAASDKITAAASELGLKAE